MPLKCQRDPDLKEAGQHGTNTPVSLPPVLTYSQLRKLGVIYGRNRLQQLEDAGKFPERRRYDKDNPRSRIVWVTSEVIAWLNERDIPIPDLNVLDEVPKKKKPKPPPERRPSPPPENHP